MLRWRCSVNFSCCDAVLVSVQTPHASRSMDVMLFLWLLRSDFFKLYNRADIVLSSMFIFCTKYMYLFWLVMKIIVMSVNTIPGNFLILVFPEGSCPDKFCNCYFPQMFCYRPLSCCSAPPFCKNKRTEQPQFVYLPEVKSVSEWRSE